MKYKSLLINIKAPDLCCICEKSNADTNIGIYVKSHVIRQLINLELVLRFLRIGDKVILRSHRGCRIKYLVYHYIFWGLSVYNIVFWLHWLSVKSSLDFTEMVIQSLLLLVNAFWGKKYLDNKPVISILDNGFTKRINIKDGIFQRQFEELNRRKVSRD